MAFPADREMSPPTHIADLTFEDMRGRRKGLEPRSSMYGGGMGMISTFSWMTSSMSEAIEADGGIAAGGRMTVVPVNKGKNNDP